MQLHYTDFENDIDVMEEESISSTSLKTYVSRDLLKQEILLVPNKTRKNKLEFFILIISVMLIVSASWLTIFVMGLRG